MVSAWYEAKNGSFENFVREFSDADLTDVDVLRGALGNKDLESRVQIASWLLDRGVDPSKPDPRSGSTTVHVLVDQVRHDFEAEVPLLRRLLDSGADVNAVTPRWGTALQTLLRKVKYSDVVLAPFYDVFFVRPDLDLLKPGWQGNSSLEMARTVGATRARLAKRMEQYLTDRGVAVPEREV